MKKLSSKQISYLRGQAHHLSPVVIVGQHGVTEAVLREVEITLKHHELIKVQIRCDDQTELHDMMDRLTDGVKATLVQVIGHKAVLYRQSQEKKIKIPV
ncbi:MAG TPA: ribosome assembly RNA-binding protein YhbY [Oligoflexus sp.]|uniref:ribosome assembly RNA-binding protein YhbY n=1 Tax=Oligoflexus sp. TaxID=1971216 RepID=UPI002D39F528|nr:ribosome assembly RNA-binding protein YhbY [Oligoflexus sp.]HYX37447.1 ribosome assembly RNA-binding protein YhbY [Oligoflexus sp.]